MMLAAMVAVALLAASPGLAVRAWRGCSVGWRWPLGPQVRPLAAKTSEEEGVGPRGPTPLLLRTRTNDAQILYWLGSSASLGRHHGNERCRDGSGRCGCTVGRHRYPCRRWTRPAKRAKCRAAGRGEKRVSTRGAKTSGPTPRTA